jgi:molecular chaperone DnaK (HSP70)
LFLVAIQSSGGLSKDEIEKMVRAAEKFSADDKKRREIVEEVNRVEGMLHDTESKMEEYKDQISSDEVKKCFFWLFLFTVGFVVVYKIKRRCGEITGKINK